MQKVIRHKRLRADASINRELATLLHMLSKAVERDLMERNPFEKGKSLMLKHSNQRTGYPEGEEVPKLPGECRTAEHLHHIVVCALNTGMRREEILNLKWNQIRNGFIYIEKIKTKTRREIPVND